MPSTPAGRAPAGCAAARRATARQSRRAQTWNDVRIELDEPFKLPPFSGLDVELEAPGVRVGRRSRRRCPPRESRAHIVEVRGVYQKQGVLRG